MKPLSKPQMDLLAELSTGMSRKLTEVNTLTLASLVRNGLVHTQQNSVRISSLGTAQFRWTLDHKFSSWKSDLDDCRRLKAKYYRRKKKRG